MENFLLLRYDDITARENLRNNCVYMPIGLKTLREAAVAGPTVLTYLGAVFRVEVGQSIFCPTERRGITYGICAVDVT